MTVVPTGISVVVPTRGRSRLTERLLMSLAEARVAFEPSCEVLIVDDSPDPERQEVQQLCLSHNARYVPGMASVREKRNLGIREAQYAIVLFVDSDCEATPALLQEHLRMYLDNDSCMAGVVGLTEFVGEDSWMWGVIQRTQFLNAFSFARRLEYPPWATCSNTSYRREALEKLGGFETRWPARLGGDDTDLGLRLGKSGYRLRGNPDAVVLHSRATWNSFSAVWKRAFRWGRMDVHLYYRRHTDRVKLLLPGFRSLLILLVLASLVTAGLTLSAWPLLTPLAWFVLFVLLRAALTVAWEKKPVRDLDDELAADLLGLANEFGTLFEAIVRWEPACFVKSVQRGPVLPTFTQQELVVQQWAMWLSWLIAGILQSVLLA